MDQHRLWTGVVSAAAMAGASCAATAAPIVFEVGGSDSPASIQATVDAFRAALGNPNNGNAPGQPGGRREINWDGGGSDATAPGATPFTVFLNSRGAQFTTAGTGFFQAPPAGGADGGLASAFSNPTYGTTFGTFSALRLFTPAGSNITDGLFFVPGTDGGVPATVAGFGAVFTDVDLADTTQIQFFASNGDVLYQDFVPVGTTSDASLSFLGVAFDAGERIARVRITTGTAALGPNDDPTNGVDVVAMDDFLYAEPIPEAIPAPASVLLFGLGSGVLCVAAAARRRPVA